MHWLACADRGNPRALTRMRCENLLARSRRPERRTLRAKSSYRLRSGLSQGELAQSCDGNRAHQEQGQAEEVIQFAAACFATVHSIADYPFRRYRLSVKSADEHSVPGEAQRVRAPPRRGVGTADTTVENDLARFGAHSWRPSRSLAATRNATRIRGREWSCGPTGSLAGNEGAL